MAIAGISLGAAGSLVNVIAVLIALLLPAVQSARDAAQRSQSANNLKQIGLAMHNYHDVTRSFPAGGYYNSKGQGQHSWQTMLLPYVEQAQVYAQVNFNSPWDDAVNANAMKVIVPQYLMPAPEKSTDANGRGLSAYAANSKVLGKNTRVRISDIVDGTSNTILAGEVASEHKAWGDPSNVRDPADGINKGGGTFGRPSGLGVQFLLGDGSIRFLNNDTDPKVLEALSTPAGGEIVSPGF